MLRENVVDDGDGRNSIGVEPRHSLLMKQRLSLFFEITASNHRERARRGRSCALAHRLEPSIVYTLS